MKFESYTLAERPDLIDEQNRLMEQEWPDFVIEGEGGHGWNALFSELPAEGWDWALAKGHEDKRGGASMLSPMSGLSTTSDEARGS